MWLGCWAEAFDFIAPCFVGTRTSGMTILMADNLKHPERSGGFYRDGEHGESPT